MSEWRDTDIKKLLNTLERIAKALEKKKSRDVGEPVFVEPQKCDNCKHFFKESDRCLRLNVGLNNYHNCCDVWERIDR